MMRAMEILPANRKGSWILVPNIIANVERVRRQVAAAAERAGRDPAEVTIIAVSKTRTVAEIQEAMAAGLTHFGENRVQELKSKWEVLHDQVTWHMIGTLQTNKAKQALQMASLIHSVDRDAIVEALARQAERLGTTARILVQVNISGEATKHGVAPEELPAFLRRISQRGFLEVEGLMTMAPLVSDPEETRPIFRRLRLLAEQVRELDLPHVRMRHLSMGMSGDFEVAVEEGATLVRIGTAIFGAR